MTTGVLGDGVAAGCHIIAKFPALGLAICMTTVAGIAGVMYTGDDAQVCGGDHAIAIEDHGQYHVGDCPHAYRPLTRAEIEARCAAAGYADDGGLCAQFSN